jgi:uncharacterized protein (TIGR03435 family)
MWALSIPKEPSACEGSATFGLNMCRIVRSVVFVNLGAITAFIATGQGPPAAPAFEVVSLKPSAMNAGAVGAGFFTYPGGRVVGNMCKLDYLIQLAFNLQPFQIEGGPGWIHKDRFDLEAKPSATSQSSSANPSSPKLPPNGEQRMMLRTLLADRFQLQFHRQTAEGAVYLLVKNGKSLGLHEAADKTAYPWVGSVAGAAIALDGLKATNASMQLLAERLSLYLERPVIDRTGIMGAYDFQFAYPAGESASDVTTDIIEALQAIGLKLESSKAPVETLVIDHAEKPTAN